MSQKRYRNAQIIRNPEGKSVTFRGTLGGVIDAIKGFNSYTAQDRRYDSLGNKYLDNRTVSAVKIRTDTEGRVTGVTGADGRHYKISGSSDNISAEANYRDSIS